jgi:hypothetical protein
MRDPSATTKTTLPRMTTPFFVALAAPGLRGAAEAEVVGAERLPGDEQPDSSKQRAGVETNAADPLQPSRTDERDRSGHTLTGQVLSPNCER